MERITLDFSKCKSGDDLHEEIKTKFDFPEWYGKNLDALWDLLNEDFVIWNESDIITIIGTEKMSTDAFRVFKEMNDIVFARVMEKAPNIKIEILS